MIIPITKQEAEQAKTEHIDRLTLLCATEDIKPEVFEAMAEKFTEFCKIIGV